jgi:hypothetical protein
VKRNGNELVFTKVVEVPASGTYHLAINLMTTGLPSLKMRARARGAGLAGHELRLFENADVENTNDPERGRHRNRNFGDDNAPFGDEESLTAFLFHSADFTLGTGGKGAELWASVCPAAGTSDTGEWKLDGAKPKYYLMELTNTSAGPAVFSIEVDYNFQRTT